MKISFSVEISVKWGTCMCLKYQNKPNFRRNPPFCCTLIVPLGIPCWFSGSRRAALTLRAVLPGGLSHVLAPPVFLLSLSRLSECLDLCILSHFPVWQAATLTLAGSESSSSCWVRSIISHCSTSFLMGKGSLCKADLSQLPWALNKKGEGNSKWISSKNSPVISRSDKPFRLCFGNTWTWLSRTNFELLRIKIYDKIKISCLLL